MSEEASRVVKEGGVLVGVCKELWNFQRIGVFVEYLKKYGTKVGFFCVLCVFC